MLGGCQLLVLEFNFEHPHSGFLRLEAMLAKLYDLKLFCFNPEILSVLTSELFSLLPAVFPNQ